MSANAVSASQALVPYSDPVPPRLISKGLELLRLDDFEAAGMCFKVAISYDPDNADAHNGLGLVCIRQGNLDAGIASFRDALHLDPSHIAAAFNFVTLLMEIGCNHLRRGRLSEAETAFSEAFEYARYAPECRDEMCANLWILSRHFHRKGQVEPAVRTASMAVTMAPGDLLARRQLHLVLAVRDSHDPDARTDQFEPADPPSAPSGEYGPACEPWPASHIEAADDIDSAMEAGSAAEAESVDLINPEQRALSEILPDPVWARRKQMRLPSRFRQSPWFRQLLHQASDE